MRLICDDCKFAVTGRYYGTTECPILGRSVNRVDECQVSRLGLLAAARDQEPDRDRLADMEQDIEDLYDLEQSAKEDDNWGAARNFSLLALRTEQEAERLRDSLIDYAGGIAYLWSRTRAPSRRCPLCGKVPVDSVVRLCPDDGRPLVDVSE